MDGIDRCCDSGRVISMGYFYNCKRLTNSLMPPIFGGQIERIVILRLTTERIMSGPYCKTCVHFAKMPLSDGFGECMDRSKIIFSGGNNITSAPEVAPFYYCNNHAVGRCCEKAVIEGVSVCKKCADIQKQYNGTKLSEGER
jgi:hypothetical protein